MYYTCAGKLANVVGKICSRRLTNTAKNTLTHQVPTGRFRPPKT